MDLTAVLNAPWLQPLVGLLVTILGSWLGARNSGSTASGISQHAVTHGERSKVTQTVNQNTWQITAPPRQEPSPHTQVVTIKNASSDDDEFGRMLAIIAGVIVGVAALTWGIASNWTIVSILLRLIVLAAMFVIALTWRRWPDGVIGAWPLRIAITVVGSAILWAVTVLPLPVGDEPSLVDIDIATSHLGITDSIGQTISLLGMRGIFTYELRLAGLALLLMLLVTMASRGLGAVIAESAARHNPPRLQLIRFGNRLIGTTRMGIGYFSWVAVTCVIALLIIHPSTVGWLSTAVDGSTLTLP